MVQHTHVGSFVAQPCQSPPYIERSRPYRMAIGEPTNTNYLWAILASHACSGLSSCFPSVVPTCPWLSRCSTRFRVLQPPSLDSSSAILSYRRRFTGRCFGIDLDLHHVQGHEQNAARCVVQVVWRNHKGNGDPNQGWVDPDEVAMMVDGAQKVIIVPGYGMAVSQCQHQVKEFGDLLEEKFDTEVKYAIHPVAGRMPGHMNVLLAEANVPYEQLIEMDEINPEFPECDVAVIIGANDTCNPAARTGEGPLAGMPIIDADQARTVVIIKRSLSVGLRRC